MNDAITDAELQLLANNLGKDGTPAPIFNLHVYNDVDEQALLQRGQNELQTFDGLKAIFYFKLDEIDVLWQLAYHEAQPTEVFILEYVTKAKAYPDRKEVFEVKMESVDPRHYQKLLMKDIVIPFVFRILGLGAEKVETWKHNCIETLNKRG